MRGRERRDDRGACPRHGCARATYQGLNDLYVADYDTGTVFLFKNDGYTPDGTITNGISGPWDVTLDRSGNLYVANAAGGNITEYAPGASTPSFTYSYGMVSPRMISVDRNGNLFESDFTGYDGNGTGSEFAQGSNYPLHTCSVSALFGVATDASGDVFVDYNVRHGGGYIEEFKGGFAGCSPTILGARIEMAAGLRLDRQGNLLICDANARRIDIVPPPYSTITGYLKNLGHRDAVFMSINKTNDKVFTSVSGFFHSYVFILGYPGGRRERQLGYGRGKFGSPYGVVDAPNAVL